MERFSERAADLAGEFRRTILPTDSGIGASGSLRAPPAQDRFASQIRSRCDMCDLRVFLPDKGDLAYITRVYAIRAVSRDTGQKTGLIG